MRWRSEGDAHVVRNAGIKAIPFVPDKSSVRGFVYDVATGRLREVTG